MFLMPAVGVARWAVGAGAEAASSTLARAPVRRAEKWFIKRVG
jgi:hypothetical protein